MSRRPTIRFDEDEEEDISPNKPNFDDVFVEETPKIVELEKIVPQPSPPPKIQEVIPKSVKTSASIMSKIILNQEVESVGREEFKKKISHVWVKEVSTGVPTQEEATILQNYHAATDIYFDPDGNKYALNNPTRHTSELIKLTITPWTQRLFDEESPSPNDGKECCFWVLDSQKNIHYGRANKYKTCRSSNPKEFYDFVQNTSCLICTNSFSDYKLSQIDLIYRSSGERYNKMPREIETLDLFKIIENCRPAYSLLSAKHVFSSFFPLHKNSKIKRPAFWENDYLCPADSDPSKRLEIIEAIFNQIAREVLPYTQSIGLTVKEALEEDVTEAVSFHENWMKEIRTTGSLTPFECGSWQNNSEILRENSGGSQLGIYDLVEYASAINFPGSNNLPVHIKVKLLSKELSLEMSRNKRGDSIYYIGHGCILGNLSNEKEDAIMIGRHFDIYCPNQGFCARSAKATTHFAAGPVADFYLTCKIAMDTIHLRGEGDSENSGDERESIREYEIFISPDNYMQYLSLLTESEKMKFDKDRLENPWVIHLFHNGRIFVRNREDGIAECPFDCRAR